MVPGYRDRATGSMRAGPGSVGAARTAGAAQPGLEHGTLSGHPGKLAGSRGGEAFSRQGMSGERRGLLYGPGVARLQNAGLRVCPSQRHRLVLFSMLCGIRAVVGLNLIWTISAFQHFPSVVGWNAVALRKDFACRPWYQTESSALNIRNVAVSHRNLILAARMQLFNTGSFGGLFVQKKTQKTGPVAGKSEQEESLWKSTVDPSSGKEYYYNTVTLETRWDRPETMDRAPEPIQMGRATATATKSDAQQVDPTQLDPLYFRFNDKATTHPRVSCSEYTAAGHLSIRSPTDRTILPPSVPGSSTSPSRLPLPPPAAGRREGKDKTNQDASLIATLDHGINLYASVPCPRKAPVRSSGTRMRRASSASLPIPQPCAAG